MIGTTTQTTNTTRLLRLPQVIELTGLSRDTIYRLGREGRFPRRIKVSERASCWRDDEISKWLDARTAERDGPKSGRMDVANEESAE